jgi:peptidoglycan/xylan/chitin deacetylase (PgdA/CDA1 family)
MDAVAITFDDGFVNFRDIAAPRLLANGLTSTVFVVSEHAGRTNAWDLREPHIPQQPLLDWPALGRLREQGVTLGSHSRTHANLATLSRARIEEEVCGSIEIIERETGARPATFAYPFGRVNAQAAAVVERVFRYACTTEFRLLDGDARLARLPRLDAFSYRSRGCSSHGARGASRHSSDGRTASVGLDRPPGSARRMPSARGAARNRQVRGARTAATSPVA